MITRIAVFLLGVQAAHAQDATTGAVTRATDSLFSSLDGNPVAILAVIVLAWREFVGWQREKEHRKEREELVQAINRSVDGTHSLVQAFEWLKGYVASLTGRKIE